MFVVTLPASAAKNPRSFALKAKKAGADVVEIRGDILRNSKFPAFAEAMAGKQIPNSKTFPLPILFAPRRSTDRSFAKMHPTFIDFELSEMKDSKLLPKGIKLILSHHDYRKTPSLNTLQKIILRMLPSKPWAVKIATEIVSYNDLAVLLQLQDWLKQKKVRSIVLGMGPKAHLLRVLSPLRNVLTYAFLDGFSRSAVGQLPLSLYKLTKGRKNPKFFGIIGGSQISVSLSPVIHNTLFQKHKVDALYSCFPTDDVRATVRMLQKIPVQGFSVTAPFKADAYRMAKKHDAVVAKLGVANTLVRSGRGFNAFNTDVYGIEHGYPELRKVKSVAILGAGGAVPSVILAVRHLNPKASITVFARDTKKAEAALQKFHVAVEPMQSAAAFRADAVLCAVSEDVILKLPKPSSLSAVAIDLRYGKETLFLHDAAKQGYRVRDGIPMLIHQALRQFEIFTGKSSGKSDVVYLKAILAKLPLYS